MESSLSVVSRTLSLVYSPVPPLICLTSIQFSTEEDLTYNLKTNLFGVINTVNAFLPLLKENKEGKKQIFVTTSILGSIGGPVTSQSPAASACELTLLFPILRTKESSN